MSHPYIANGAVYDDFRAVSVGTNLNGRTSTSGHTWTATQGTWAVRAGIGWPTGDAADGNAAGSTGATRSRVGINFGSADCDVEATLERPIELVTPGGLMLRWGGAGYYAISVGAGTVEVQRVNLADTPTLLAGYTGLTIADLSVIRAVCSGNDITTYLDGVELGTVTDSTYAGTVHGLYQRFSGGDSWNFYAFNMHPTSRPSGILVGAVAI